jgi:ElaB/YqjD/DUF883 family membrane-anchored ribosome-binding protein
MSTGNEYHELILNLLNENSEDIKQLKKDINRELSELKSELHDECSDVKQEISNLKAAKQIVIEQKKWKDKVNDVWSPPQMKESKDEIYIQKNKWAVGYGVFVAVQVIWIIYTFFSKK